MVGSSGDLMIKDDGLFFGCCDYFLQSNDIVLSQYFCNSLKDNNILTTVDGMDLRSRMVEKRIGKTILTGDEDWFYDNVTKCYYYFQQNKFCCCTGYYDNMICTHFRWVPYSLCIKQSEFQGGNKNQIMFNFDNGVGGIDNFKKWLKNQLSCGTPVEIYYIMQFPEIIYLKNNFNPIPRFVPYYVEVNGGEVNPDVITTYSFDIDKFNE